MGRKKKEEPITVFQDVMAFKFDGDDHLRVEHPDGRILWFAFAGGVRYVEVTDPAYIAKCEAEFEMIGISKTEEAPPEDREGEDFSNDDEDAGKELVEEGEEDEEED